MAEIKGTPEANVLLGSGGDVTMRGLAGDDTYEVDTQGDRVREGFNQGIDVVESSISYTLGANLEDLVLKGIGNINGTGNGLTNNLIGNSGTNILRGLGGNDRLSGGTGGNDTLDGGQGSDTLFGNAGDNTFIIDNVGDRIENAGAGIDTVQSSISFSLSEKLENLILLKKAISGTGNELANQITGNGANNILVGGQGSDALHGQNGRDRLSGGGGSDNLIGGAGDDTLTGGSGNDQFIFGKESKGSKIRTSEIGTDTITDFRANQDVISLSRRTFALSSIPGIGFSDESEFEIVETNDLAEASDATIVFSRGSRTLFYNPNGSRSGFGDSSGSGEFAVLNTNSLRPLDFILVN